MKNWIVGSILGVLAIAPMLYMAYYYSSDSGGSSAPYAVVEFHSQRSTVLEPGAELDVLSCQVIDGYIFQLYLNGNQWIEAHLPVATSEEAIPVVIECFNNSQPPPPTVVLRRKVADYWIVDFYLTKDGRRVSIVDLLREKGLLLYQGT